MKENQRSRLSKRLLKESLIKLLQEKPIQKISIKEICDLAELNRSTFYKHYVDEYALLEELSVDALNMLLDSIRNSKPISIAGMLTLIYNQRAIIKAIFNNNADETLPKKILNIPEIKEYIQKDMRKNKSENEIEVISHFVCYGAYYVLKDWLNSDCALPIDFLANQILTLSQKLTNN